MAAKKTAKSQETYDAPETLNHHPFFGLRLDEDQKNLRDAIWSKDTDIVFVDAPAGTGKTTIAVSTASLMVKYGRAANIVYVMHPVNDFQGFLPGTITEKSSVYFEALYQALLTAGEFPDKVICSSPLVQKDGSGYVTAITDTYLRGSNIGGNDTPTILILDEAQNFDEFSLRKTLTRACENTKVIVIGHQLQCDLRNSKQSGFARCMAHFKAKNNPRFAFCELHTCHRSLVAQVADEAWDEKEDQNHG